MRRWLSGCSLPSGDIRTNVHFTRLPYDSTIAGQYRVGTVTNHDGADLAVIDPAWLRRQIGVVLQENVLFNSSVRENISLVDPAMTMEKVVAAAKLAGTRKRRRSKPSSSPPNPLFDVHDEAWERA